LASLDELGAGFTLATHDLEIRGAGELLGEEQSGQIQEVGFSMYTEMLERAVAALKAGKIPDPEARDEYHRDRKSPRDDTIREEINAKIKKRELFRPFAPSTTREAGPDFFELDQESPYMNILAAVRPERRAQIPAVTHVDGTARVHTVSAEANPLYHRLITAFGARTGVPVLLNTSFNIQEPIVNTPEAAIRTYLASGMDLLAIGGYLCDLEWREQAAAGA
jgi:hypothetical protein